MRLNARAADCPRASRRRIAGESDGPKSLSRQRGHWVGVNLRAATRDISYGWRHKTVRKASPRRHRIVRGSQKISAITGVSGRGPGVRGCGGSQRGRLRTRPGSADSCQTEKRTGPEYELRSRTVRRAHDSLAVAFLRCRQYFWLAMRLKRGMGGALVRPSADHACSIRMAGRLDPEADGRRRGAFPREY